MRVILSEAQDLRIEVWSTQALQRDQQRIWEVPRRLRGSGCQRIRKKRTRALA
jgi:hypothetical protein